ncbi:MAG TPA: DUF1761 domain-containing protein [Steroidobacteraceae bacterium]|jgi:hypothetical protein
MLATVNWLAVAVAALGTFLIGGPWYTLFRKPWQRAMGMSESGRGHPLRVFGLAYVFSFIAAGCLAALLGPEATASSGLVLGATLGACLVAASFGINYLFANRNLVALLIDGGYHIVQFAVFGLVLGAWH